MKKLLLLCGTIAALLYAGTVLLDALLSPGYRQKHAAKVDSTPKSG